MNHINSVRIIFGIMTVLLAGNAYADSDPGSAENPFVLTNSDTCLDSGSYYAATSSVAVDPTTCFYIGKTTTGNHLTVSGPGVDVSCGRTEIGSASGSSGDLTIRDMATMTISSDYISPDYSTLRVGRYGNGELSVLSGGKIKSIGECCIAMDPNHYGKLLISGKGSSMEGTGSLFVGHSGNGVMEVNDGASANTTHVYVGYGKWPGVNGDSTLTITGEGSSFTSSDTMYIGCDAQGSLIVSEGAHLTTNGVVMGYGILGFYHIDASATVTGAGSTWTNTNDLYIGSIGKKASLEVLDGAKARTAECIVCDTCCEYAQITVNGADSILDVSGSLYAGGNSLGEVDYSQGIASIRVSDGGEVRCASAVLGYSACVTGDVYVTGPGSSFIVTNSYNAQFLGIGALTLSDGALAVIGGEFSNMDKGVTRLANGYLALKGEYSMQYLLDNNFNIQVSSQSGFVPADASNLTITYIDGTINSWSSNTLYKTYSGKVDLTGYTLISAGSRNAVEAPGWAGCKISTSADGWFTSPWYGDFCSTPSMNGWIWHKEHGWQHVESEGDEATLIYDLASDRWWYVNPSWYPWFYDYKDNCWCYYLSGAAPERQFWDGGENASVTESDY
jgi:T5SS/PEP-CTERM-associated repeat protein